MDNWALLPLESAVLLQRAVEALALGISDAARELPPDRMNDYIERELAKFAVQMRPY